MNTYDFQERLTFSTNANGRTFEEIICETLPGIVSVTKTDTATDKTGVDYVAALRRGSIINIDLKLRDRGCSRWWDKGEEELALETWSVLPEGGRSGKAGWTLDESKATHYTLHAFDPRDSDRVFLLPFQLLRKAFRANLSEWHHLYRVERQNSGRWRSECIFIPISVVLAAVQAAIQCHLAPLPLFNSAARKHENPEVPI